MYVERVKEELGLRMSRWITLRVVGYESKMITGLGRGVKNEVDKELMKELG